MSYSYDNSEQVSEIYYDSDQYNNQMDWDECFQDEDFLEYLDQYSCKKQYYDQYDEECEYSDEYDYSCDQMDYKIIKPVQGKKQFKLTQSPQIQQSQFQYSQFPNGAQKQKSWPQKDFTSVFQFQQQLDSPSGCIFSQPLEQNQRQNQLNQNQNTLIKIEQNVEKQFIDTAIKCGSSLTEQKLSQSKSQFKQELMTQNIQTTPQTTANFINAQENLSHVNTNQFQVTQYQKQRLEAGVVNTKSLDTKLPDAQILPILDFWFVQIEKFNQEKQLQQQNGIKQFNFGVPENMMKVFDFGSPLVKKPETFEQQQSKLVETATRQTHSETYQASSTGTKKEQSDEEVKQQKKNPSQEQGQNQTNVQQGQNQPTFKLAVAADSNKSDEQTSQNFENQPQQIAQSFDHRRPLFFGLASIQKQIHSEEYSEQSHYSEEEFDSFPAVKPTTFQFIKIPQIQQSEREMYFPGHNAKSFEAFKESNSLLGQISLEKYQDSQEKLESKQNTQSSQPSDKQQVKFVQVQKQATADTTKKAIQTSATNSTVQKENLKEKKAELHISSQSSIQPPLEDQKIIYKFIPVPGYSGVQGIPKPPISNPNLVLADPLPNHPITNNSSEISSSKPVKNAENSTICDSKNTYRITCGQFENCEFGANFIIDGGTFSGCVFK